ncbi:hypothetical protein CLU83_2039 [Flavobacterium sp. 1]|nr:hypothetical protein CLU83_2039 [Flavobacterium sp. 1]
MSCFNSSKEELLEFPQRLVSSLSFSRHTTIVGATRKKTKNNNTMLAKIFMWAKIGDRS